MVMTTDGDADQPIFGTEWEDIEIAITLDSGCADHVMDAGEAPGYSVLPSAGSRRGQNFIVGDGAKVPNKARFT